MKIFDLTGDLKYETLYVVMRNLAFDVEQIENTIIECRKYEKDN